MKTKPILGVVTPDSNDALSLWRAMGPLSHPSFKDYCILRVFYPGSLGWADLASCDAVFFHRPFLSSHLKLMETCKTIGVPIWCDWDDDLFEVPEGNPAYQTYASKESKERLVRMAQLADKLSFATFILADAFQDRAKFHHSWLIPNAVDPRVFQAPATSWNEGGPLLWRGTASHLRDLDLARPAIEYLMDRHQIHWVGYKPWWASGIHHAGREPLEYFRLLADIGPKVVFVPLEDCPLNQSKSDIAAMEATMVGAVAVTNMRGHTWDAVAHIVPDLMNFAKFVDELMNEPGESIWFEQAREYYLKERSLEMMNGRRLLLLEQLLRDR